MTTAVLGYLNVQKRNFPEINWKMACFSGFLITSALLVFYVWQVQDLIRGSYLVNSYEKQLNKLSDENKNLQVSFAENDFLGQVMSRAQAIGFQKVTSVKYIQILDNAVAKK